MWNRLLISAYLLSVPFTRRDLVIAWDNSRGEWVPYAGFQLWRDRLTRKGPK